MALRPESLFATLLVCSPRVCLLVDMHAGYVGRTPYYACWPPSSLDHNTSMFDRCATTDQSTSTAVDCALPYGRQQVTTNAGQTLVNGAGSGFHVKTSPECRLPGSVQMTNGTPVTTDVKPNASSDESFCSADNQPPSKNSSSTSVDGFIAPLPLPAYHSTCPPSVVDAGVQHFSPLSTFAGYTFPVLPPASTTGLVPPPPSPGYRFALGTTSRGRLQRQTGVKSSIKLTSQSRTRSHTGSYVTTCFFC